jgi:hypothetical protein
LDWFESVDGVVFAALPFVCLSGTQRRSAALQSTSEVRP